MKKNVRKFSVIRLMRSLRFNQVSRNRRFLSLFLDNFPYLIYEGLEKVDSSLIGPT